MSTTIVGALIRGRPRNIWSFELWGTIFSKCQNSADLAQEDWAKFQYMQSLQVNLNAKCTKFDTNWKRQHNKANASFICNEGGRPKSLLSVMPGTNATVQSHTMPYYLYHIPSHKFCVQPLAEMGRTALDENTSSLKSFDLVIGSSLASTDNRTWLKISTASLWLTPQHNIPA
jgi:hypothetical protein